jgi:hypothetical protein
MKVLGLIEKLESSSEFREFSKKNPKAFLSSGFFVFDFDAGKNVSQMNFFLSGSEIATFSVSESGVEEKTSKLFEEEKKEKFHELKLKGLKVDIDSVEEKVMEKLKKEKVSAKLSKIIAVLQPKDEGDGILWNLTCILEGLLILRIFIDAKTGKITKFEKAGLMDFVKIGKK